jgi:rRNA biogenesis protein RRP5
MAPVKRKSDDKKLLERPSKKSKASVSQPPKASILRDEGTPFPRGGSSVLTPLEQKQIRIKAREDVLFEQKNGRSLEKEFEYEDEGSVGNELETPALRKDGLRPKNPSRTKKTTKRDASGKRSSSLGNPKTEGLSYKVRSPVMHADHWKSDGCHSALFPAPSCLDESRKSINTI